MEPRSGFLIIAEQVRGMQVRRVDCTLEAETRCSCVEAFKRCIGGSGKVKANARRETEILSNNSAIRFFNQYQQLELSIDLAILHRKKKKEVHARTRSHHDHCFIVPRRLPAPEKTFKPGNPEIAQTSNITVAETTLHLAVVPQD